MALDKRYFTTVSLDSPVIDKNTGLPMANGKVYFWQDDNRLYPKPVFELTGAPPNYTYIQLPNPITLDAAGCYQNANGDNVAVYYYPYNQFGELELYYISAFDEDGLERFTRQAWPNVTSGTNPVTTGNASMSNEISNGQFVDVLFDPSETLTISWGGSGTETAEIAPGWTIEVNHTGAANVQITRNPIAGSDLVQTNAPYTLTILPSSNINSLKLMQRLNHNTSLWSPVSAGIGGYINAGILLGTGTQDIELLYRPDQGTEQSILMASNNTGAPFYYSETIQLDVADNSSSSDVGYIDFIIKLPQTGASTISSLQILGLESDENAVPYQQQTVDRQKDQLFHYYQPKIQAMPIPTALIGWDFPMNPAQFTGDTVAESAIGANKSKYVWDQTIIFQSANSGVGVTRATSGALKLTAAATTQAAIIQYLPAREAKRLLADNLAVNMLALSDNAGGLVGKVSLWATDDASLPDVAAGTNNSIVLTLDADGKPATLNGVGWEEVPRGILGDAKFTLSDTMTEYNFSGWDMSANALATTATYFAIVVGFASLTSTKIIDIKSVSLCVGDIATPPPPMTLIETISQCEQFYEKSYKNSDIAGTATTAVNAINRPQITTLPSANKAHFEAGAFSVDFRTIKSSVTPDIYIYPASTNTVGYVDATIKALGTVTTTTNSNTIAITQWTIANLGDRAFTYTPNYGDNADPRIDPLNDAPNEFARSWVTFHYVADARLGIV